MLELCDVHAGYGATPILHGISLTVRPQQAVALLGRNGMGKTTTIRAIVGEIPTTAGVVRFGGEDVTGTPLHRRCRSGMGLVPEARRVFPSLTVREHLEIARRPAADGVNRWPLERLEELFPVLARRSNQLAGHLSGGEQQLLVTARALTTNPTLLLLDEPTEGLAPAIVEELADLLRRLKGEEGAPGMLVVEQNLRFALGIADFAYVLVGGRVAYEGDSALLAGDRASQEELLGVGAR